MLVGALPLSGSNCLDEGGGPSAARQQCEAVCDAEGQCNDADPSIARSKAACLAALCTADGFNTVPDGDNSLDLATLAANDCERTATDCAELLLCSCPDSCARTDQCTGEQTSSCVDDCENVLAQDPSLYAENRCKMESTCADLAACGQASGE